MEVEITFDPAKDSTNRVKHGLSLTEARRLDWDTALIERDDRRNYGEDRMLGIGYVGHRLHVVVFVERDGARRIISLRKTNEREDKRYAKT